MKVAGLVHALKALEPRLDQLVIVGGWAWYLYRKYLTGVRDLPGEFTLDIDVVLPRPLPSGPALNDLLERADFEHELSGDDTPPVTRYTWPSREQPQATIEFLTPARGSGSRPTLSAAGVVAQQLRTTDLLLIDPLLLKIDETGEGERFNGKIRLPSVGGFILQKTLILSQRRQKKTKDLFYIFDLAEQAGEISQQIEADLHLLRDKVGSRQLRNGALALRKDCADPAGTAIGKVLDQIPVEKRPARRYITETLMNLAARLESIAA